MNQRALVSVVLASLLGLVACDPVGREYAEVRLVTSSPPVGSEVAPGTPIHLRFEIQGPPSEVLWGHFLPKPYGAGTMADWTAAVEVGGTPELLQPGDLAIPFTMGQGNAVLDVTMASQNETTLAYFTVGEQPGTEPRVESRWVRLGYRVSSGGEGP